MNESIPTALKEEVCGKAQVCWDALWNHLYNDSIFIHFGNIHNSNTHCNKKFYLALALSKDWKETTLGDSVHFSRKVFSSIKSAAHLWACSCARRSFSDISSADNFLNTYSIKNQFILIGKISWILQMHCCIFWQHKNYPKLLSLLMVAYNNFTIRSNAVKNKGRGKNSKAEAVTELVNNGTVKSVVLVCN